MNPALSIVVFTTLCGSAQGLVVALAVATLAGAVPSAGFLREALLIAQIMLLAGLVASFMHLGHKLRAWRAIMMWRTSWMSREVIVLPAFMAVVAAWWWQPGNSGKAAFYLAFAALILSMLLWYCTAMIYACLRFVQEWAHPLTIANYMLIGLSSGLILCGALGVLAKEVEFAPQLGASALFFTVAAGLSRGLSLVRNRRLRPKSSLQSAIGVQGTNLRQISMGMTAGSFNTREFFHRASAAGLRRMRLAFLVLGFVLPALLCATALYGMHWAWLAAFPLQFSGLLMERWFFFAEANHPQNLYYQVVS